MAPKYTLIYFNGRGYAEVSRLILAHAKVEYVDKRLDSDQWSALKKSMPFGHVPVLDVNGVLISESRAIARYLAKEHGLGGKNSLEAARADAIVDALFDILNACVTIRRESDTVRKEALHKTLAEETLPQFLKNLEAILEKNNSEFLVGDALTWADIVTAHVIEFLRIFVPNSVESYKGLNNLESKVHALPSIQEWINKRPKTDF